MEERIITDYPNYSITNSGIIKNITTNKILKGSICEDGYISIKLKNTLGIRASYKLHRLVCQTFLENPENKPTVDHIDRDKKNNNIINLRWATSKEQNQNKSHPINQRKTLNRPVNRIDNVTNSIIESYNSLVEAKEWLLQNNITKNNQAITAISQVCHGKKITAYGFKWSFIANILIDTEQWIDLLSELVNGVNGYTISSFGRIKSKTGRINTGWDNNGYINVSVGSKSYQLHRLIAIAFIKSIDPNKIEVNHKDGNKKNNNVTNLEWVTHRENVQHAFDIGLSPTKSVIQYNLSGKKICSYHSIAEAERSLQLESSHISKALDKEKKAHGYIWRSTEVNNAIPEKITLDVSSKKPHKKVIQYDLEGIIIREFESSKEVSEYFKVKIHTVNNWCTGHRKSSKGFIFKYK